MLLASAILLLITLLAPPAQSATDTVFKTGATFDQFVASVERQSPRLVRAVNTVPPLRAAAAAGVELRIVSRASGARLLGEHRTKDGRTATPLVVLLRNGQDAGAWVERPIPLQEAFERMSSSPDAAALAANRQGWYDRDGDAQHLLRSWHWPNGPRNDDERPTLARDSVRVGGDRRLWLVSTVIAKPSGKYAGRSVSIPAFASTGRGAGAPADVTHPARTPWWLCQRGRPMARHDSVRKFSPARNHAGRSATVRLRGRRLAERRWRVDRRHQRTREH